MHTRQEQLSAFERLLDVQENLRQKCPWDHEQTMQSLRAYTIEEVYELASAIIKGDMTEIKKELGDVLEHVVFYALIASESGNFDIADVCNSLTDKLIFRHPHIYPPEGTEAQHLDNSEQVEQQWEQVKLKEKGGNKTVLAGVPDALPSLIKASRIQDKARRVGFDWEERSQVWEKVKEEIGELQSEIDNYNHDNMEAEFGDVLFSIINAARLYDINPDNALERTNRKFIRRFNYLEQTAKMQGKQLKEMTLQEMDEIWNQAKHIEE